MKMIDKKTGEEIRGEKMRAIVAATKTPARFQFAACVAEVREEIFHRSATDKKIMKRFDSFDKNRAVVFLVNTADARAMFLFTGQPANNYRAKEWPLPNVILSVKVHDQATASARVPLLMVCPAAFRVIDFRRIRGPVDMNTFDNPAGAPLPKEIDGIILNPNASSKLNDPLREQATAAGWFIVEKELPNEEA